MMKDHDTVPGDLKVQDPVTGRIKLLLLCKALAAGHQDPFKQGISLPCDPGFPGRNRDTSLFRLVINRYDQLFPFCKPSEAKPLEAVPQIH